MSEKIERVDVAPLFVPLEKPWVVRDDFALEGIFVAAVEMRVSDGSVGIGYGVTYNRRYWRALTAMIEGLSEMLIGADPTLIEEHSRRMLGDASIISVQGIGQVGVAALDIALWDIRGKQAGQPVYRLLGGTKDRIPVYASTYFGPQHTTEQCVEIAVQLTQEQHFHAVKVSGVKAGSPAEQVHRIEALQAALGPDVKVMVDMQVHPFTLDEAMEIATALDPYGLTWIEDPCVGGVDSIAKVAAHAKTQIACGEHFHTLAEFERAVELDAGSVLIVDLNRIGGFTNWQPVVAYLASQNKHTANHLLTEVSVHAISAAPSALIAEYSPWTLRMFEDIPPLDVDGNFVLSDRPGLGLTFDRDKLDAFRLN